MLEGNSWNLCKGKLSEWRRSPEMFLLVLVFAVPLSHTTWRALLNNYAVEKIGFGGFEIGLLQSIREVPGLLTASIIYILLVVREQRLATLSLLCLGLGVALTGFFPNTTGLYLTTLLMSSGFHYCETLQQSLALQWVPTKKISEVLGKLVAVDSMASIVAFVFILLLLQLAHFSYFSIYLLGGLATVGIALMARYYFILPTPPTPQKSGWIFRKQYWLFYALTLLAGARRQIFVVFAGFLMVTKFGYSATTMTVLFLVNHLLSSLFAPRIGRIVACVGERTALLAEYSMLALIFLGYAVVDHPVFGTMIYITDNLSFALSVALKSYFKRIAKPEDITSSSGVSTSINHIIAVFIPVLFGLLWNQAPQLVFFGGSFLAGISCLLAIAVPRHPEEGNETIFTYPKPLPVVPNPAEK